MSSPGRGVLFFVYSLLVVCSAQEILQYPENRTVYLEQTAVFTCIVTGGEVHGWRINGTSPTNLPPEIQNDIEHPSVPEGGNTHLTLELLARAEYNGTKVQCLTANIGGGSDESENVTLLIQGLLSAVGDVTASYSSSSVTLNWTAPFSLDVTGVDPDIWYSVIIYNVTDENNPTVMDCTDCINITDTHYTFTPNSPGLCQSFNFSIIPINGAGQGETSHKVTGYSLNGSAIEAPRIKALVDENCKVTFSLVGYDASDCSYDITSDVDTLESDHNVTMSESDVVCVLPQNKSYSMSLTIMNEAGGSVTVSFNISTFDVQRVNATGDNNMVCLEGEFINNTRAKGCVVVLQQCHNGGVDLIRVLPRPKNTYNVVSNISNIPPSTYHLFVHDLEENGLPNEDVAYLQSEPVHVMGSEDKTLIHSPESLFLESAQVYIEGDKVMINCEFKEVKNASCILVYRDCETELLMFVEYYPTNTTFPVIVNVTIENIERFTFAIFGRNGSHFDEHPIITINFPLNVASSPSTSPTVTPVSDLTVGKVDDQLPFIIGVAVGLAVVILLVVISSVLLLVIMRKRIPITPCGKQVKHGGVPSSGSSGSFTSQLSRVDKGLSRQESTSSERSATGLISADGGRKKEESKYTTVEKVSGPKPSHPLETTVKYEEIDIRATQKLSRSDYADLELPPQSNGPEILPHQTTTEGPYVDIKHQEISPAPVIVPPTVETVMSKLYSEASQWKEIAEMMGFDEDMIDEIDTNNDNDVMCLQVCVEEWISKLHPSWERVEIILSVLREKTAERALQEIVENSNRGVFGVAAEASQTNNGSGAVVIGNEETKFYTEDDGKNKKSKGNRGKDKVYSKDDNKHSITRSIHLHNHTTAHEDDPALIGCDEDDEMTQKGTFNEEEQDMEMFGEIEGMVHPMEAEHSTSSTITKCYVTVDNGYCLPNYVVADDSCYVALNLNTFQFTKEDSLNEAMVDGDESHDYHRESVCLTKPEKQVTDKINTTQVCSRNDPSGSDLVAEQCTDNSGFLKTIDGMTEEVNEKHVLQENTAEDDLPGCLFFQSKIISPIVPAMAYCTCGAMVSGLLRKRFPIQNENYSALETADVMNNPPTPPPLPTTMPCSVISLSLASSESSCNNLPVVEINPLDYISAVVHVLLINNPRDTTEKSPSRPKDKTKESSSFLKTEQWGNPPANFHQKIVKWMSCGIRLGFPGPEGLIKLWSENSLI